MEIEKEKIKKILNKHLRYKYEEQINVLRGCLFDIEEKVRIEKEKDAEWLRIKEARKVRLEERNRIHGYRLSRFKKPLPPLEERRQYVRICRRCEGEYRTFAKHSQFCDGCSKSGVTHGVPSFLRNKSYKT